MHWTREALNRKSSLSYSMKLIQQYEPHFSCCVTHIELTTGWRKVRSFLRGVRRASRRGAVGSTGKPELNSA